MTSSVLAPSGVKVKAFPYETFMGLDAYRDGFSLDTGNQQYLTKMHNGFSDFRGIMMRDAGATKRVGDGVIDHVNFVGEEIAVWAQLDGAGITLNSERGHKKQDIFPLNSVVTSAIFNRKAFFFAADQDLMIYDGFTWAQSSSPSKPRPGFGVAVNRRLATAGYVAYPTAVFFTRADDGEIFPDDEPTNASYVTKAFKLDVANQLRSSDMIRGLGVFEKNNLVIFTKDQALIYYVDPDYTKVQIVDKTNINVGTVGHRTIADAGTDMLFCSRSGVHSLRRSEYNGVTLYTIPLSHSIELLYRKLYRRTPNKEAISAYFDQDRGQYHIFFPMTTKLATRLTLTLNPVQDGIDKWSTGDFLNARCGARLGDTMVWGTVGGLYNIADLDDETAEEYPTMVVETPVLWHGALNQKKDSFSFVLQASGRAVLTVEAFDQDDRQLSSHIINIDDSAADDNFIDVPLNKQYERKFEHSYRGVWFRFTVKGSGLVRIVGFAVVVRAP